MYMHVMMKAEPGRKAVKMQRRAGPDMAMEWTVDHVLTVHTPI